MTPLRILHVIVSDRFAGVEQFVRRLAIVQATDGHDVFVAGGASDALAGPLHDAGVRFVPVTSIRAAVKAIRSIDVDVVNSHMTAADIAAATSRLGGPRQAALVSTRHFALRRGTRGPGLPYRVVERMLDAEIAISRAVADSIHVPSTVVHSGVDPVELSGLERTRTVLMAQRLQPEKQTALGVRAFAASGIAADGWTLQIAGIGAQEAELRALVAELDIADAVEFLGFRDDLPHLMQTSGMLVATTPNEGLGLTVIEAMASGLPVVASAAGGHLDTIGDVEGGALFAAADADGAALLLRELASDAQRRDELGAAQRDVQRSRFTLRAQADQTEAVYRAAIAGERR